MFHWRLRLSLAALCVLVSLPTSSPDSGCATAHLGSIDFSASWTPAIDIVVTLGALWPGNRCQRRHAATRGKYRRA